MRCDAMHKVAVYLEVTRQACLVQCGVHRIGARPEDNDEVVGGSHCRGGGHITNHYPSAYFLSIFLPFFICIFIPCRAPRHSIYTLLLVLQDCVSCLFKSLILPLPTCTKIVPDAFPIPPHSHIYPIRNARNGPQGAQGVL